MQRRKNITIIFEFICLELKCCKCFIKLKKEREKRYKERKRWERIRVNDILTPHNKILFFYKKECQINILTRVK